MGASGRTTALGRLPAHLAPAPLTSGYRGLEAVQAVTATDARLLLSVEGNEDRMDQNPRSGWNADGPFTRLRRPDAGVRWHRRGPEAELIWA
jgi:hypothetical protein